MLHNRPPTDYSFRTACYNTNVYENVATHQYPVQQNQYPALEYNNGCNFTPNYGSNVFSSLQDGARVYPTPSVPHSFVDQRTKEVADFNANVPSSEPSSPPICNSFADQVPKYKKDVVDFDANVPSSSFGIEIGDFNASLPPMNPFDNRVPKSAEEVVDFEADVSSASRLQEVADIHANVSSSEQHSLPETSPQKVAIKSTLPKFAWMNYSSEDGKNTARIP